MKQWMRLLSCAAGVLLSGCGGGPAAGTDEDKDGYNADEDCDDSDPGLLSLALDGDCDGSLAAVDCDDSDADISPDADEICDGEDNNCSGTADDDVTDGDSCPLFEKGAGSFKAETAGTTGYEGTSRLVRRVALGHRIKPLIFIRFQS